jgi:hypothetical protein
MSGNISHWKPGDPSDEMMADFCRRCLLASRRGFATLAFDEAVRQETAS